MKTLFDELKREHVFNVPPKRVVSLVPSDTLTLADLGVGSTLVGRTDYCELPEAIVAGVPSVGGTKNPNLDAICDLSPDLVLANKEENTKADLEKLVKRGVRVFIAFPCTVSQGIAHLARLARAFHVEKDPVARDLVKRGYEMVREAEEARKLRVPLRAFCPIWMDPLMTVNQETYIGDALDLCGAINVFAERQRRYPLAADLGKAKPLPPERLVGRDTRYPRVTLEEVAERSPELVILPDEPHPFSDEDAKVFLAQDTPAARAKAVVRTGGKDVCWYGSRAVEGIPRLRAVIDRFRPLS